MTPKDKSKQLFDDFLELMDIQYKPNAKYMAIRCVDEIIQELDVVDRNTYMYIGFFKRHAWWKEVKTELEKM